MLVRVLHASGWRAVRGLVSKFLLLVTSGEEHLRVDFLDSKLYDLTKILQRDATII